MNPAISIIIITHRRIELLKKCLKSISESVLPEKCELIVIVNGTDVEAVDFLRSVPIRKLDVHVYTIKGSTNGKARNEAIRHARGEILYFLDDDITVDKNIFVEAISAFRRHPDVHIFGGPNLTPPDNSLFQKCCGYVLSSIFGSAKMRHRYIKGSREKFVDDTALILCNLAIGRKVFEKETVLLNEDLICNEENLLLQELQERGYRMLYCPGLIVYHDRRRTLKKFFHQIFKYGKGRTQQTLYFPRLFQPFTMIPTLFVFYLASLVFFRNPLYLLPFFVYVVMNAFSAYSLSLKYKNPLVFLYTFILFPLQHIAYGLGFLSGLKIALRRSGH